MIVFKTFCFIRPPRVSLPIIAAPIVPDRGKMSSAKSKATEKLPGQATRQQLIFTFSSVWDLLAAAAVVAAAATAAVVADSVAAAAAAEQKDQDDDPPAVTEPVIVATHISYLPTDICAAVCRADSSYSAGAIW